MKIYVVIGGYDYEGFSGWTMKSFVSKEAAEAYSLLMITDGIVADGGHYILHHSEVFEQEVEV